MPNTITANNETEHKKIPNSMFDNTYMTERMTEVKHLRECGIEPATITIKESGEFRIRQYRYRKTSRLFRIIAEFYEKHESDMAGLQMDKMLSNKPYAVKSYTPVENSNEYELDLADEM